MEEIRILCRKQILEKKLVIISETLPSITGFISPMRLVFQNLISNSLKYTEKDRNTIINISCTEFGVYWQFAVNDNGIGIEQEYFEKDFRYFLKTT